MNVNFYFDALTNPLCPAILKKVKLTFPAVCSAVLFEKYRVLHIPIPSRASQRRIFVLRETI